MKKIALRSLITAATMAASMSGFAASDGSVDDASSTGTSVITLEVGNLIVVRNLKDIDLTTSGTAVGSDITGSETLCVGTVGFSNYSVELDSATGTANTGVYQLTNGTDTITYQVAFDDDQSSASGSAPGADGSIPATFSNVGNLGCASDNAKIFVTVPSAQWESISDSTDLQDTLTVTVSGS